jgi:hypothetical protein
MNRGAKQIKGLQILVCKPFFFTKLSSHSILADQLEGILLTFLVRNQKSCIDGVVPLVRTIAFKGGGRC